MFIWKAACSLSIRSAVDVADQAVSSLTLLADRRCEQLWRCCQSTPDTLHIMEKFILPSLERLTPTFSETEELKMFICVDSAARCRPSKPCVPYIGKYLHGKALCERCRLGTWLLLLAYGPLGWEPMLGRGWGAGAGLVLVRLSLHYVLLCRELLGRSPPLEVLQAAR